MGASHWTAAGDCMGAFIAAYKITHRSSGALLLSGGPSGGEHRVGLVVSAPLACNGWTFHQEMNPAVGRST